MAAARALAAALAWGAVTTACTPAGSTRVERPAPPAWETAGDLVPGDVDLVVRVDLVRLRASTLYPAVVEAIGKRVSGTAALAPALERGRSVMVGTRRMPDGFMGDGILIIDTSETALDSAAIARVFGDAPSRILDGLGLRASERTGDVDRFDPVIIVVAEGRAIALATASEADALVRLAQRGPDRDRVEAPARGLLSFAVRSPRGLVWGSALGAGSGKLLESLKTASGVFELQDDGLAFEGALRLDSPESAQLAAQGVRGWAERKRLLDGLVLEPESAWLHVRARIPLDRLAAWFAPPAESKRAW